MGGTATGDFSIPEAGLLIVFYVARRVRYADRPSLYTASFLIKGCLCQLDSGRVVRYSQLYMSRDGIFESPYGVDALCAGERIPVG
jgi:hypothetical protein